MSVIYSSIYMCAVCNLHFAASCATHYAHARISPCLIQDNVSAPPTPEHQNTSASGLQLLAATMHAYMPQLQISIVNSLWYLSTTLKLYLLLTGLIMHNYLVPLSITLIIRKQNFHTTLFLCSYSTWTSDNARTCR